MTEFWNKDLNEMPYDMPVLCMRSDGNVYQDFMYDETIDEFKKSRRHNGTVVIAWAHIPPIQAEDTKDD